jgi:5'-nucleotidase
VGDAQRPQPRSPTLPPWVLARKLVLEENTIEGAVAALNEMVAGGIDVRLCSSPLSSSPCCVMEKVEWAVAHLGKSWVDRIILTRDKTLVRGDILLDDAPLAKGSSLEPVWEHVYFDQPYNRPGASDADPSRRRLVAWKDWRSLSLQANTRERI